MRSRTSQLGFGKWFRRGLASVAVVGLLSTPAVVSATPHPSDADFGYEYHAETQQLGFWFGPSDADVECVWSDSVAAEPSTEISSVPETQCFVVGVAGPNDQVNHGTVVSGFVHSLKDVLELSEYDGPRGQFVSEIAKSDAGKSDDEGHGPPAIVEEKKDSRGLKNKGNGNNNGKGNGKNG